MKKHVVATHHREKLVGNHYVFGRMLMFIKKSFVSFKELRCDVCRGGPFTTQVYLNTHRKLKHDLGDNLLGCPHCKAK
jgi:hypothetical protein